MRWQRGFISEIWPGILRASRLPIRIGGAHFSVWVQGGNLRGCLENAVMTGSIHRTDASADDTDFTDSMIKDKESGPKKSASSRGIRG
jgi:hypothetical protein